MKTIVEFYHCHESGLTCVRRCWKFYGLTVWTKDYGLGYHENIRRAFIDNGQTSEKAGQIISDRCRWDESDPDGATPFTWKSECGVSWRNGEDEHFLYVGHCGVCGKLIMPKPFNAEADRTDEGDSVESLVEKLPQCPHCGDDLLYQIDRGVHCDGCEEFHAYDDYYNAEADRIDEGDSVESLVGTEKEELLP